MGEDICNGISDKAVVPNLFGTRGWMGAWSGAGGRDQVGIEDRRCSSGFGIAGPETGRGAQGSFLHASPQLGWGHL